MPLHISSYGGIPNSIRPAVAALIVNNHGHVLLQKRADNGLWSIPGGVVEPGESILEALNREIAEETTLKIKSPDLVAVYSHAEAPNVVRYENGNTVQYVCFLFRCVSAAGEARSNNESTLIAYWDPMTLPSPMVVDHERRISLGLRANSRSVSVE